MTSENGHIALTRRANRRSVIKQQPAPNARSPMPSYDQNSILWFVGQYADDIAPWGTVGKTRDNQLRAFITKENYFTASLGIICSRNAGFSWKLDAPPRTAARLQYIFDTANRGEGWHDLLIKTSIDLYTQDDGAFWEIVRETDSPTSPVIGLNTLDAARCFHTGFRDAPVVYLDRDGQPHLLKWWNVVTFADMPANIELAYGRQYSALSRLLLSMQIARNIALREHEKTGGRNTNAIHLVKGITSQQLNDAIAQSHTLADAQGLSRYMNPIVIGTIDPKADVGHDTIEMAGLPDGFDKEIWFKQYIAQIAMAFMSDYQEFAPLPGGGLGTGAQSEMLHLKSHGKGPGLFMKLISHAINMRILPGNSTFYWDEQDLEAEKQEAEVKAIRAQTRAVRIASFEITPQVARQLANDEGDLPIELMDLMNEQDITEDVTVDDEAQASHTATDTGKPLKSGDPAPTGQVPANGAVPGQARRPSMSAPTPLGPKVTSKRQ